MMVGLTEAFPVEHLSIRITQAVHVTVIGKQLEGAINRGKTNVLTAFGQQLVQALRGEELIG